MRARFAALVRATAIPASKTTQDKTMNVTISSRTAFLLISLTVAGVEACANACIPPDGQIQSL